MSGAPSWSRTRPGSPRLKEYCRRAGAPDRAFGAATSRDAWADRLAERDAEETHFTIPNRTFAWHDLMARTMSCLSTNPAALRRWRTADPHLRHHGVRATEDQAQCALTLPASDLRPCRGCFTSATSSELLISVPRATHTHDLAASMVWSWFSRMAAGVNTPHTGPRRIGRTAWLIVTSASCAPSKCSILGL
jgi:hypothetical protein